MEIRLFHVRIVFCSMFQIKRKKVEEYLLSIRVFVYLCVKFKFRYLRSNIHVYILTTNTLYYLHFSPSNSSRKINSFYLLQYVLSKQSL